MRVRALGLAALAALTASLIAGVAVPASGAGPAVTRFTPGAKGLSHEVFGFFLPSAIDHVLTRADWSVLSTVAYFGIVARTSGNLARRTNGVPDPRWTAWDSPAMDRLIEKAHGTGTNVVLAVTRFAWTSDGWAASAKLLSSGRARSRLARQIAAEVERRGIDGVNLDFEPIPTGHSADFVALVREVRERLDEVRPGLDLTVASTGYIANYDVAGLTARGAADAIFIMAYHYNGSWSTHAGAVSPLTRRTYDVTDTVEAYLRYTEPENIILGVPYYGYAWSTETGHAHSRTRPGSSTWGYPGSLTYRSAVRVAEAYGRRWDPTEQGPWVRWQTRACSGCPLTWRQMYYEDAQSLALKYDLVIREGLRGTGMWTLGYEGRRTELNDVLRATFVAAD
jgi:spore germination protein YaaH